MVRSLLLVCYPCAACSFSSSLVRRFTGLWVKDVKNVIIAGLAFSKSLAPTDLVSIQKSTNVWVDHCSFANDLNSGKDDYDGQLDVTHASDFITISWNEFSNSWKTSLVGHSDKVRARDSRSFVPEGPLTSSRPIVERRRGQGQAPHHVRQQLLPRQSLCVPLLLPANSLTLLLSTSRTSTLAFPRSASAPAMSSTATTRTSSAPASTAASVPRCSSRTTSKSPPCPSSLLLDLSTYAMASPSQLRQRQEPDPDQA